LNLVCEGLLLGTRREDHKETPTKLHPAHQTFANIMTVNADTFGVLQRGTAPLKGGAHRTSVNTFTIILQEGTVQPAQ
jgi:hypothetical protein